MRSRECVIIPEFGAFISKDRPARLDYAVHRLTPPSKEFVFNTQLVSDDDVFANYLSERQHVTYQEAVSLLHDFAMQCLAKLEVDKELNLEGIGTLYYIDSQNIAFAADADVNFNGDAFGLAVFTVQPIYRSETYQVLQMSIEEKQKAKNTPMTVVAEVEESVPHKLTRSNYKWYRAAAYSTLVATAMVVLGWGADRNDSKLASWNPLFYSSPNEFVVKHLSEKFNARETFAVDGLDAVDVKVPVFEFNPELTLRKVEVEKPKTIGNEKYYSIIGASLNNAEDAERCAEKFRKSGFVNAQVLPEKSGKYRVEYESVVGKEAAIERLEVIKNTVNESAWLLIKK